MKIGPVIGSLCKRSGVKQRQICRELRVSPNFLSMVVQGKRNISFEKLEQVASVLGVPVSYICALADDSNTPAAQQLKDLVAHWMEESCSTARITSSIIAPSMPQITYS